MTSNFMDLTYLQKGNERQRQAYYETLLTLYKWEDARLRHFIAERMEMK
ncbi:hypothetical protein [Paenibacillus sp. 3LSP]|jgi:hypothetical protein|nr:hypothetical protein [Paenibacillus sp. 3LSP]